MAKIQISLVIDKALLDALDEMRRKELSGPTRQAVIRQAIAAFIKGHTNDGKRLRPA